MNADLVRRRALVTGATGYVGSHLVAALVNAGWHTSIVVRPGSNPNCVGDLLNGSELLVHDGTTVGMIALMGRARPDMVFHLASLFLAQHQAEDIYALVTDNVLFGAQLVEAMAATGSKNLINVNTSWQHHSGEAYNPVNLYAATKQAFDDILRYYLEVFAIKALSLTLFDTYGPEDRRHKLVPLLHAAAVNGAGLQMSPGEQSIDLVYIDDIVSAFLYAADLLKVQEATHARYCISSGEPVSLRQLVATIEQVTGKRLPITWGGRPYRPREAMFPFCPYPVLPGWVPAVSLGQGVALLMSENGTMNTPTFRQ